MSTSYGHTMGYTMMLASYASLLPAYVAMIVGIVLALVRWKIHPRASMFAVIGLGAMLLNRLIWAFVYAFLPSFLYRTAGFMYGGGYATLGLRAIDGLITAGCWALILAAIFCDRSRQQSAPDAAQPAIQEERPPA